MSDAGARGGEYDVIASDTPWEELSNLGKDAAVYGCAWSYVMDRDGGAPEELQRATARAARAWCDEKAAERGEQLRGREDAARSGHGMEFADRQCRFSGEVAAGFPRWEELSEVGKEVAACIWAASHIEDSGGTVPADLKERLERARMAWAAEGENQRTQEQP